LPPRRKTLQAGGTGGVLGGVGVVGALQSGLGRLDRIARSSRDLHNILGDLKDRGCGFVSLGDSWCDTTSDVGRLVIVIMGGIAEFERELIRKRCQAGIVGIRSMKQR
jgi:DNA invertase Pin-like site-specific DNA recombinase